MSKKNVWYFFMSVTLGMLCVILPACGSAPSSTNSTSAGMDMDTAIREAAAQMDAKLPGGTMIALVSVASTSAQLSDYVIGRLEAALVGSGKLIVVDRANLDQIRAEQGFQMSGEVDDESAKNIGKLLGAGAIVTGAFADLGDVYSLSLKAINMETATVAVSYPADIAKSTRITTLLASGGGAAGTSGARTSSGGQAVVSAEPAKVYQIGDTGPAGGIVFYDMGFVMDGWRYLEAAPQDFPNKVQFGHCGIGSTETGIGTGMQNTIHLVSRLKGNGETLRAAQVVSAPQYGGYDDWFLPSMDELNLMYENLKLKRLGTFSNDVYLSSSSDNLIYFVWTINFADGKQNNTRRAGFDALVRAVRRF